MSNIKDQKFFNPASNRMVGYWSAKRLGLIPKELLDSNTHKTTSNIEVKTITVNDLNLDERLFVPIKTGNRHLDEFISADGGFMPASNVIVIGGPGIGKTTVSLNFISRIHKKGKRVLFISGEMGRIDMVRYARRMKDLKELNILFLADYADNAQFAVEKILEQGWDMVLMDSWAEISESVKDSSGWGSKKAETWILDLMQKHNEGRNSLNLYTCFLVIQQVTKDGKFLGSNRLKHMTSAMMEMSKLSEDDGGGNVIEFSKNRLGSAGQKISFTINNGTVNFAKVD